MTRTHGRYASGKRLDGPVPHGHGKVVTLTAAVRLDGVPGLRRGDQRRLLLGLRRAVPGAGPEDRGHRRLDNLSRHEGPEVARRIEAAGATVRYLPAYSPDLNPIERLSSVLKAYLGRAKARAVDALIEAMGQALRAVRASDIRGWFRHDELQAGRSTVTINKKPLKHCIDHLASRRL